MNIFKKIVSGLLTTTTLLSVVAFGGIATSAKEVAIAEKFLGNEKKIKLTVAGPPEYTSLLKKQCKTFSNKFPDRNIKITVKSIPEGDTPIYLSNNPQKAADVFAFSSDSFNYLVKEKLLLPVPAKYKKSIKSANTAKAFKSVTVNNKLYAYPECTNGYYLVYNKAIVSSNEAKTFEGILKACKRNNKHFIMDTENGFYSCVFAFTAGMKINGLDKHNRQKFTKYNTKTAVATLKEFSRLMHKYNNTFKSLDIMNVTVGFYNGTVGAGIDGCWNSASHKQSLGKNYGATKLPTIKVNGKNKQLISLIGYKMFGVKSCTNSPKTASLLAYYLSGENCQIQRAKKLEYTPTNKKALKNSAVKKNKGIQALNAQTKHSVLQKDVSETFWFPMGILGEELYNNPNPNTYNYKKLINATIANIIE